MTSKLVNCNCVDLSVYSGIYLGGDQCPHLRLRVQHSFHQLWKGADVCPALAVGAVQLQGMWVMPAVTKETR